MPLAACQSGLEFMVKKILLVSGALFLVTNWLDFHPRDRQQLCRLRAESRRGRRRSRGLDHRTVLFAIQPPFDRLGAGRRAVPAGERGRRFYRHQRRRFLFVLLRPGRRFVLFDHSTPGLHYPSWNSSWSPLAALFSFPLRYIDRTESLAQAALGYVIAAGIKVFTLAVVVSFAFAIFPNIPVPDELSFTTQFVIMGTALTFVLLALKAPSLASSMINGGPSLGVGALAQTAAAVGAAGAVGYAGIKASGAIGGAAGSVIAQARQGLQNRPSGGGGNGPSAGPSSRFSGGGGGSGGGAGTAVAVRASTAVRSPGTAVGPAFRRRITKRLLIIRRWRRWKTITRFWWRIVVWRMVFARQRRCGCLALEMIFVPAAANRAPLQILMRPRQGLKRAAIGTTVALHGGNGGSGSARVDISSRK